MQKLPLKILYVEDETLVLFSVTEILKRRVDEVIPAINGEEGFELFQKHSPDVVITDINMPKMSGLDMARKIKRINPDIHIYLLSAYAQPDYLLDAIDIGVKGFLKKPLDKEKLFPILREISEPAILKKRIQQEEHNREIAKSALEESERKFRTLAENIPGTVFIYEMCKDGETRIMHYVGPGFEEMVGTEFAQEINYELNKFFNLVHSDDFDKFQEAAEEALENNESLNFEYRMRSSKGEIMWVRSICRGSFLENGNTLWQGVLVNINDRKLAEEKIRKSEEHYHELFRNSNNILWISDLKGNFSNVNKQFRQILGYDKDAVIGQSIHSIVDIKDREKSKQNYAKALEGETVGYEVLTNTYCEKQKTLWISLRPIYDNNKLISVQGFANDITIRKAVVKKLRDSENKYRSLYNSISDMIFVHTFEDDESSFYFTDVNDIVVEKLGYSREELYKMTPFDIEVPQSAKSQQKAIDELLEKHSVLFETAFKRKNGTTFPVEIHSRFYEFEGKKCVLAIVRDISDRKEAENLIKQKEVFSNALFEYNPVETIIVDKEGKIVRFNMAVVEARSHPPKIGNIMYKDFASKHKKDMYKLMVDCIKNNKINVISDTIYREGQEDEKHLHITIAPFPEGAIITSRDITRQVLAEDRLKKEIEEKELLIKEINHRVKNNFALVSSLLEIQQHNIEDENVRNVFEEARNRIQSIALVHKQLYSSVSLADIDFSTYIESLIGQLMDGFDDSSSNITVEVDIKDAKLDISKAIPCGLIVNELITNTFKHGFHENKKGTISVSMHNKGDSKIELIVANDGQPFPDDVDFRNTQTLGLQLVTSLVQQIDGEIALDRGNVTKFRIIFKK